MADHSERVEYHTVPVDNEKDWRLLQGIIKRYDLNRELSYGFPALDYHDLLEQYALTGVIFNQDNQVRSWITAYHSYLDAPMLTIPQFLRRLKENGRILRCRSSLQ